MKRPALTIAFLVSLMAGAVTITFALCFTFMRVWSAFEQAPITSNSGTEQRLLLTTMVGSTAAIIVSLLSALFSAVDRSRAIHSDRTKKAHELSTDGAFSMWKAATVAYRLLQRADDGTFVAADQSEISRAFQDAETATLLFNDDAVRAFQQLWSESEAIAGRLLLCGQSDARAQSNYWNDEYEGFLDKYKKLRLELKRSIGV